MKIKTIIKDYLESIEWDQLLFFLIVMGGTIWCIWAIADLVHRHF
jgi:hypothetical protein